jgi:hypothetical protein
MSVQRTPIRERNRWQRAWDWYTDFWFRTFLVTAGALVAIGVVIALVVGHGETTNTSCKDAQPYVSLLDSLDGHRLTGHDVARLHAAAPHLQKASDDAVGSAKPVIAQAAQLAASAQIGQRLDSRAVSGRYDDVCDFSGGGGGKPGGGL